LINMAFVGVLYRKNRQSNDDEHMELSILTAQNSCPLLERYRYNKGYDV
jgi:hypothetical protein